MQSFSEIYLLNLHGSAKKKEVCPDGSKDENVFDIQQGVAIGVFVKKPGESAPAKVFHADLQGLREGKYHWLKENDMESTPWVSVYPKQPHYLFIPQDTSLESEYENFWKVTEIFPVNSTGVKPHRDHFAFDFDLMRLRERIAAFRNLAISDEQIATTYDLKDRGNWKLNERRKLLAAEKHWEKYFSKALYRPFDIRSYYHHENIVERPREEIMRHMFSGDNYGLLTSRQIIGDFKHVFVTRLMPYFNAIATAGRFGSGPLFPLYLYPIKMYKHDERTANLSSEFIKDFSIKLGSSSTVKGLMLRISS